MSTEIGFGIVGAGMVARYHARAIAETPGAPLPSRALRRALLRATGRRSLVRVLRAIPPGGPSPRTGRAGGSTATR